MTTSIVKWYSKRQSLIQADPKQALVDQEDTHLFPHGIQFSAEQAATVMILDGRGRKTLRNSKSVSTAYQKYAKISRKHDSCKSN